MNTLTLKREFQVTLTIGRAIELKRLGLLDVFELPTSPEQLQSIIADPVLFAQVLWEMIDKSAWTFEAFCEMLAEADQEKTWEACTAAIVDFFPFPMRPLITVLFASVRDARNACAQRMLDSLTKNEQLNTNETSNDAGMVSGIWPASLASIQAHSPIAHSTLCPSENSEPTGIEQVSCSL